jgi:predicted RecA/RadA family phage recombinase
MIGYAKEVSEEAGVIKYAHTSAVVADTPIYKAGIGWMIPQVSADANVLVAYRIEGIFRIAVASGISVTVGQDVFYNDAIGRVQAADPGAGHLIGTVIEAATGNAGGTVFTQVILNRLADVSGAFGAEDVVTEGIILSNSDATVINTAGSVTLTAANLRAGILLCDPNGAARTYTTPTAADLVAAIADGVVGTQFEVSIRNTADANGEWITLAAGAGCTLSPTTIQIGEKAMKSFLIRLTNVGSGTEAYTIYEKNAQEVEHVGAGLFTTAGGDATESIPCLGAAVGDIPQVTINTVGTGSRTVTSAICTTNAITVTLSGDPSNDTVLNWTVHRAR